MKASKSFALRDNVKFILEMNYFNLLNRVRFNGPNNNVDDANYGYVTSGEAGGHNPRQGQISGRVTF